MNAQHVVTVCDALSGRDFLNEFAARGRAVIVKAALSRCPALSRWSMESLRASAGQKIVPLKAWESDKIRIRWVPLGAYIGDIKVYEDRLALGLATPADRPGYLHDVPLGSLFADIPADLDRGLADYFPEWYGPDWYRFAQFFLGPSHSLTPLHFDCLLTHNLFFQIRGRKRFVLLPHEQHRFCYRHQWRWFAVDVENPDFARHPLYRQASPVEVIVEPGDLLYMPPGMLHHVRSLDAGISFNVDWHTPRSALHGVLAMTRGMPLQNVYYNAVIALGLWGGVPSKSLMPYYGSYLNYVS